MTIVDIRYMMLQTGDYIGTSRAAQHISNSVVYENIQLMHYIHCQGLSHRIMLAALNAECRQQNPPRDGPYSNNGPSCCFRAMAWRGVLYWDHWEGLRREVASAILSLKKLDNEKTLPEEEEIMLRLPDRAAYFAAAWCKIISTVGSHEADYGTSPFQA